MKKLSLSFLFLIALLLFCCASAYAEDSDEWKEKPVFTEIYEIGENTLQLKWEGKSNTYRIILDNKELHPIKGGNQIQLEKISPGIHRIKLIPIQIVSKGANTDFSFEVPVIGGGASWDWKVLGIDPKDILEGEQSDLIEIDYTRSTLTKAKPEIRYIETDFSNNAVIAFRDLYDADTYRIIIKQGKNDERYYDFAFSSAESSPYITKADSFVSIVLNQDYLRSMRWLVPELNEKYSFYVQLIQYPINLIDGNQVLSSPLYSERSNKVEYTLVAKWKAAPEIKYSSQDGEGSVFLSWSHDDNGLGCEYKVIQYDMLGVIKKGETTLGITKERSFEVSDLMNGKYTFVIIPSLNTEEGEASEPVKVDVMADWIAAPELSYSVTGTNSVKLSWEPSPKVETYHISVFAGNGSLLRFVNLDYKLIDEFDIPAETTNQEFEFVYPGSFEPDIGARLKFEIYGVRHTASGELQQSATSTQTVVLK